MGVTFNCHCFCWLMALYDQMGVGGGWFNKNTPTRCKMILSNYHVATCNVITKANLHQVCAVWNVATGKWVFQGGLIRLYVSCILQAGDLQNTVVRLHSQLEQGETERHTLEYQLTLAQKDGRVSRDLLDEREEEWSSLKTSFQGQTVEESVVCKLYL